MTDTLVVLSALADDLLDVVHVLLADSWIVLAVSVVVLVSLGDSWIVLAVSVVVCLRNLSQLETTVELVSHFPEKQNLIVMIKVSCLE